MKKNVFKTGVENHVRRIVLSGEKNFFQNWTSIRLKFGFFQRENWRKYFVGDKNYVCHCFVWWYGKNDIDLVCFYKKQAIKCLKILLSWCPVL